jgi:hypothetical protein
VAFVAVRVCNAVVPSTVKVEVTVEEPARNPPWRIKLIFVLAPLAVICWSVAVVAGTPPLIVWPFTVSEVKDAFEPEMFVAA